jgi:hypothetical protein
METYGKMEVTLHKLSASAQYGGDCSRSASVGCSFPSNVVVEWLTLLLRIREVQGSNLVPETVYHDRVSWLSSVPPGKFQEFSLKLGYDRFLPNPFQFIIHLSAFQSTLHSLGYKKKRRQTTNKYKHIIFPRENRDSYPTDRRQGLKSRCGRGERGSTFPLFT